MGETLRLTLLGDAGEQPAEIDLTPLNRDWEILSRSSATNARFINGQNQVTRTLEMELAPLREGSLSIPSEDRRPQHDPGFYPREPRSCGGTRRCARAV